MPVAARNTCKEPFVQWQRLLARVNRSDGGPAGSLTRVAPRATERLMNLTIALLLARQFVTKERLRTLVEEYQDLSDEAFNRQFERDKDLLRDLGVPIVTGSNDSYFDDETGYRIPRADFELPAVSFDDEERSALGLAAGVWQQASAARGTVAALNKLRAAGIDPDAERLDALAPHISASEPAFDICWHATLERSVITFGYRGRGRRTVQPWCVRWRKGSWYLLGHDVNRDAPRVFKMSRMDDVPQVAGAPGGYEIPADVDLAAMAASLEPGAPDNFAVVAVRGQRVPWLRRAGTPVEAGCDLPDDFGCYRVPFSTASDFASEIASAGPDALVISPSDLRDEVIAMLRAVAQENS